ncbi:cytochrome ubiquinol oxidase subunit I [Sulfobacillus thermosulfidooxidans]|uniref:cytochrome ubiquinol oxidase subunit I n=1 Tax=Sulfobacillus thermosulfidooxidans TaxID=28034 RepID=UPI00096B7FA7|nr:cytochrome ubiquinol oxidase subunit I [Sulfobacillus thermosulfidooxidans]OLZ10494.1 cytochrome D ubiquinol oxidase subunit I [Sulfobacillus thermosulfidooxidans]OLZ14250.1 cytochrome D ubiquinol oxidase subunit I [Sulfobacillus thermosulfidooxidans]OLZ18993.1 cytochrome D ubiquinol oxidase subunit I [Sulfobacillus thermosulfidooxidans]
MTQLGWAELQFGVTTVFHFFFVPVTIGLAFLIAIIETIYVRTKDKVYRDLAKFWGHLFLINFAVGVVTGLLQEFQFGLDWATYSKFVGDVFGAPLAVEALAAFFLESTFIGAWAFGWDRLSARAHAVTIWLVALGTSLSAFWILTANSWMQEPVGYVIRNGRAVMTSFGDILTNPQLWVEFPHTEIAAILTGSFFMLSISAYQIWRKKNVEAFSRSFKISTIVAAITSVLVIVIGDAQAAHLVKAQPMKLAAAEALWNTSSKHAPWSVVAIIDAKKHTDPFQIQIPEMLTILAYKRLSGAVEGINQVQAQMVHQYGPGDYIPPVAVTFYSFRTMIFAGTAMLALAYYALYLLKKNRFTQKTWFLKVLTWAIALPYLANSAGWIMTEVGRQPWVVYGLQLTEQGVSPTASVPALDIELSLLGFLVFYSAMAYAAVHLWKKAIAEGLDPDPELQHKPTESSDLFVGTGGVAR